MARDQQVRQDTAERDEARGKSRGCPHCGGEGLCEVFDPEYDGRRVVRRECLLRGEVKGLLYPMVIAAHCTCEMGRWIRGKSERDVLDRVPDLADALAGRGRYRASDPTGDLPGPWFAGQSGGGGVRAMPREG